MSPNMSANGHLTTQSVGGHDVLVAPEAFVPDTTEIFSAVTELQSIISRFASWMAISKQQISPARELV